MEESEKTAFIAIIVSVILFGMKYAAAFLSGSIALKAEAFHTLADLIASLTVLAGLKLAKRKTRKFPYGLYKIENLVSVGIALIILYSGYEIIIEVIGSTAMELRNAGFAAGLLVLATGIAFWFTGYEKRIGKKISSPILIANAMHGRMDVFGSIIVLLALLSGFTGFHLDRIAALIIVGFIFKTGVQILADGARVLLDASIDYGTLSKVEKTILKIPQVVELKSLTGRNSGRFKFIEASIILKTHDLDKAHYIADTIERSVEEDIKNIDRILIHYEPVQKEEVVYAIPLADDRTSINIHFGESLHFMLVTFKKEEKTAVKVEVIENPYSKMEKGKGISSAEYLAKHMVDYVIVKNGFENKGPAYVFASSNIEVIVTSEVTPEKAFEKIGLDVKNKERTADS